jgi:hypothetical protein
LVVLTKDQPGHVGAWRESSIEWNSSAASIEKSGAASPRYLLGLAAIVPPVVFPLATDGPKTVPDPREFATKKSRTAWWTV